MKNELFKIRVGVIVLNEKNELLLSKQNQRPFWVLPGGTLEKGETLEQCAIREIKEEANLDIVLENLFVVTDFMAPDGRQALDIIFKAKLLGGHFTPETTQNIDEIGFYSVEQVQAMDCKPNHAFSVIHAAWQANQWQTACYLSPSSSVQ